MKRSLQLNPDNRPSTWEQVKEWRSFHEEAPILTSYGLMHADPVSVDQRMRGAIDFFDSVSNENLIVWKQPSNTTVTLTLPQLKEVYDEVRTSVAVRRHALHKASTAFRAMAEIPCVNKLKDINFWLANI